MATAYVSSAVRNTGAGAIGLNASVSISETGYSVENNTSTVSYNASVTYYAPSGWSFGGTTRPSAGYVDVYVNGSVVKTITCSLTNGWRNGQSIGTASGTVTVAHNNDGSKTTSCQLKVREGTDPNNASPPYTYASATGTSVSMSLTTIPRASSFNVSGTLAPGNEITINISRAVDSFTHTATIQYGSETTTTTIVTKSTDTAINYTLPSSITSKFPNAKTLSAVIVLTTYSGSTTIGTSQQSITIGLTSAQQTSQTLTVSMSEAATLPNGNEASTILSGTQILQGVSIKRLTISAGTTNSATIKSVTAQCGNESSSLTVSSGATSASGTIDFSLPANTSFVVTLTDSRGYTKTVTVTATLIPYIKPTVDGLNVRRASSTSTNGTLTASGKVYNGTVGSVTNEVSVTYQNTTNSANGTVTTSNSENTWNGSAALTELTTTSTFNIQVTATDTVGYSATKTFVLGIATPDFWIGKGKFAGNWAMRPRTELTDANVEHPSAESGSRGSITPYIVTSSTTENKPSADGYMLHFGWDNSNTCDALLWIKSGEFTGKAPHIQIKGRPGSGDWEATWQTVLDTANFINYVYPVGSIYMSINSTSPATLFGGTWEQLKDTFLLAAGSTYTAGTTGGEATHTLTSEEVPSTVEYVSGTGNIQSASNNSYWQSVSGGQAHNNMPPYLAVFIWKRTA